MVYESDKLKADKFVTGTANDGNLTKAQFVLLLNGMLGKFSNILASQVEEAEALVPTAKEKTIRYKSKKNDAGRAEA